MTALKIQEFRPVHLVPYGPALPTEYGKRWIERTWTDLVKHNNTLRDVAKLAEYERGQWTSIEQILRDEGIPTAISSGVSQYGMSHLIDHIDGKTSFTMPATVALVLATAAPSSTTTGATVTEAAYTGYTRTVVAGAGFTAATSATPSVASNNGQITCASCSGGTSTLTGFIFADNSTIGAGNALWYGTLASTVISTTQTPPVVANGILSLSMTGT